MGGWTDGKRGSQYLLNLADRTENHTRRMWQCSSSHFSGQLRRPGQACAGAELSGLLVATPPEKMRRRPVGPQTRLGRAAPGLARLSTAREIASPAIVCSSRPAGARPPREPCAPARCSQCVFIQTAATTKAPKQGLIKPTLHQPHQGRPKLPHP